MALIFVVSCGHKGHHGKSCCGGKHHKEGKMCGGDHKHKKGEHKLKKMDTDKDGKISKAEFDKKHEDKFTKMDKNSDGFLSQEELEGCGCDKAMSKNKE